MNTAFFIARRYLFAKKSQHVINIISMVSMIGVAVGTFGLIVVLSVFNGFGDLVVSLYDEFDADVKIVLREGKTFDPADAGYHSLAKLPGIQVAGMVIEENALFKYREKQFIGRIKGMTQEHGEATGIKKNMLDGTFLLQKDSANYAVFGSMVAYSLGLSLEDPFFPVMVYVPDKGDNIPLNPMDAFKSSAIYPSGVFAIQQDFDNKYMIVPLQFARELVGEELKVTAIEILYAPGIDEDAAYNRIAEVAGPAFHVKDRIAQHDFLYKILKSEKLAVFLILGLILLIATFSIIGTLTMLVIEKKKDIAILTGMGAGNSLVTKIFLTEGMMITALGACCGLILGWLICFLQQRFGLIRLDNGESFVVETYPVAMQPLDFILVLMMVTGIGFLASWYTSTRLVRNLMHSETKI